MPLLKCPVCGGDVSDAARSCPSCGHPLSPTAPPSQPPPQAGTPSAFFIMLIGIVLVMVSLAGAAGWFVYHRFQQAVHRTTAPELVDYIDSISADTLRSDVSPREVLPPDGAYELSSVEEQPSLANREQVQAALARNYPPLLRDAGVTGQVVIRMRVQADGTVDPQSITVEQSSHDAFSTAAVRVAEIMRFIPAKIHEKKVPVWVTLPITFQLAS